MKMSDLFSPGSTRTRAQPRSPQPKAVRKASGHSVAPVVPKERGIPWSGSPLEAATALVGRGFAVIPVPHKRKVPVLSGWPSLRVTAADLPRHFSAAPSNVSILPGQPSGLKIDVDLDDPMAVLLAPKFLPPTGMKYGRESKPRSHWIYTMKGPIETTKFQRDPTPGEIDERRRAGLTGKKLTAQIMVVEIRSDGAHTIAPGSTHPSGEPVEWYDAGEPAVIDPEELLERVAALAAEVRRYYGVGDPVDDAPVPIVEPISAANLIREYPALRPATIKGLLRLGEVMNLIAAPKIGKSWLAHSLLMAVIIGTKWLEYETTAGRVLLIDAELHRETLAKRIESAAQSMAIQPEELERLEIWALRGQRWTIDMIAAALAAYPPGTFRLIVIDALYRFIPIDGEENSNETMTQMYNALDAIAQKAQASIVVVHHASKGNQSDKAVSDVGAGGGAQSRAADTHLILRLHEEEGAVVVDALVRSWPRIEPFVIRWQNPGWELAPDLDPAKLRKKARAAKPAAATGSGAPPPREWTPQEFATEFVGTTSTIREEVFARAKAKGVNQTVAKALLKRALEARLVYPHTNGPSDPQRFSTEAPKLLDVGLQGKTKKTKRGKGVGAPQRPPAPGAAAPGGVGGTRARPLSPPVVDHTGAPRPPAKCHHCGKSRWWREKGDPGWTCGDCHPPVNSGTDKIEFYKGNNKEDKT